MPPGFGNVKHPKTSKDREGVFIRKVINAKRKRSLVSLYKELNDYKKRAILRNPSSWTVLVNQTLTIFGDLQFLFNHFRRNYFPAGGFTDNSDYYHFGLAAALRLGETNETLTFLFTKTGHKGFLNVLKAFAENDDREMALLIFQRFLRLAEFLVR